MRVISRINSIFAIIALLSVLVLIANNILFVHSHHLENGQTIIHAHPYNLFAEGDSKPKHEHSKNELILINLFNNILVSIIIISFFTAFIRKNVVKECVPIVKNEFYKTNYFLSSISARPPPGNS